MAKPQETVPSHHLKESEIGILQNLNRTALNGLIAEVTGELKMRMLYSLTNPADSEICLAYKVCIPGHAPPDEKIEWCVKAHQLRRIDDLNEVSADDMSVNEKNIPGGILFTD